MNSSTSTTLHQSGSLSDDGKIVSMGLTETQQQDFEPLYYALLRLFPLQTWLLKALTLTKERELGSALGELR